MKLLSRLLDRLVADECLGEQLRLGLHEVDRALDDLPPLRLLPALMNKSWWGPGSVGRFRSGLPHLLIAPCRTH